VKSFSATSFASEHTEVLERAIAAVKKNPQALFTDFQWFLYRAQNTVYFSAFCEKTFDQESLIKFVGNMVTLAPQLTHGFVGATPGQPLAKHILDAVSSIEEVDSFDGYPDKWLEPGLDLFDQKDMPLFRVKAAVRRGGADAHGRSSMILVRSSHALMEGADSSLLSRSQNSGHGVMSSSDNKVPLKERLMYGLIAALTSPIHLAMAHANSREKKEMGFRSVVFDRHQLRRVSGKLKIGQRSLMFALVMHAINNGGKGFSRKKIKTTYTTLNSERTNADDDFFRVRSINADFDVNDDLVTFAKSVEARVAQVEAKDTTSMQYVLNATFKTHRFLSRIFPFLYSKRFFHYAGGYDLVLTLVPPHRMYGNLTTGMMEPIFCGSYHPGSNLCTFVPGRDKVTFNFCMQTGHLGNVDRVSELLVSLDESLS